MLDVLIALWAILSRADGHRLFLGTTTGDIRVGVYLDERDRARRFREDLRGVRAGTADTNPGLTGSTSGALRKLRVEQADL